MTATLAATITEAALLRTYAPGLIGIGWLIAIGTAMLIATAMTGLALLHMRTHSPASAQPA